MATTATEPNAKLTLEMYGNTATYQFPDSDVCIDDMLQGFYGLAVSHGYSAGRVLRSMKEFSEKWDFEMKVKTCDTMN